jgi:hypothetical protein
LSLLANLFSYILLLNYKYPLLKKSTFGTFILAIALTLTMVISAITLSNPIHVAASTVEEDNDKDNKKEKEERRAQGQGNNGAEDEEEGTNGDTAEEDGGDGIIEEDPDVDQELLNELRGGVDTKGSGTADGEESEADLLSELRGGDTTKEAPVAISGDNAYVVWWTNKTNGNDEVMFRASNDSGVTFGDKVNLSNTTASNSQDAEVAAEGDKVAVTWWERNQTANEPVMRISGDNGSTFGPIKMLGVNGTIIREEGAAE